MMLMAIPTRPRMATGVAQKAVVAGSSTHSTMIGIVHESSSTSIPRGSFYHLPRPTNCTVIRERAVLFAKNPEPEVPAGPAPPAQAQYGSVGTPPPNLAHRVPVDPVAKGGESRHQPQRGANPNATKNVPLSEGHVLVGVVSIRHRFKRNQRPRLMVIAKHP